MICPQAMAEGDPRVPVTVLTGFLGSGKTTLLNNILTATHRGKLVVIKSEYGEVGIEETLLAKDTRFHAEEKVFGLMNGCICCFAKDDLVVVLNELLKKRKNGAKLDGIIIETAGMADPTTVAKIFFVDDGI